MDCIACGGFDGRAELARRRKTFLRWFQVLLFLILFSFSRQVTAGEKFSDPLSQSLILKLKRELASDSRDRRQQAEETLIALGQAAWDFLAPAESDGAATRLACARIRQRIQIVAAEKALSGQLPTENVIGESPSITTLALLDRIQAAVPDSVRLEPDATVPEIVLEGDRPVDTSWSGIDRFCRTLDWGWDWSLDNQLILGPMQPRRDAVSTVAGCVRISGQFHSTSPDAASAEKIVHATFRFDVSPPVRPMSLFVRDADLVLMSEGERCPPVSVDAVREVSFDEQYCELNTNFQIPAGVAGENGSFSGIFKLKCAAGEEDAFLPIELAPGNWQRIGETEFRLERVTETEIGLEVQLAVGFPPGASWESYQAASTVPPVWAKTGQGRTILATEVELSGTHDGLHHFACRFTRIRTPSELTGVVVRLPAVLATLELPFEFAEVEIQPGGIRSP